MESGIRCGSGGSPPDTMDGTAVFITDAWVVAVAVVVEGTGDP